MRCCSLPSSAIPTGTSARPAAPVEIMPCDHALAAASIGLPPELTAHVSHRSMKTR